MKLPANFFVGFFAGNSGLPARNCAVVRRSSSFARGYEGRTVVRFGKFKGRTFEEARISYISARL